MENKKLALIIALIAVIFVGAFFLNEQNQPAIKKTYYINYSSISATKQVEINDKKIETILVSGLKELNLGLLKIIPKAMDSDASLISFSHNGIMDIWKNDPIVYFTPTKNTLFVKSAYSQNSDVSSINLILPNKFIESLSANQKEILIAELEKIAELNLNDDKANELENTLGEKLVEAFSEENAELMEKDETETEIFFEENESAENESLFDKVIDALKEVGEKFGSDGEQEDTSLILSLELNKNYMDPYTNEKIEITVTSSVQIAKEDFELRITTQKGEVARTLKPANDLEANNPETFSWDGRNEKGEIVVKDLEYNAEHVYLIQLYHKNELSQSKPVTIIRADGRCQNKNELRKNISEINQLAFDLSESKPFETKSFAIVQPGYDYENVIPKSLSVQGEIEEFLLVNISDSYVLCEGKIKERTDLDKEDQAIFDAIRNADATQLTYNGLETILLELEIKDYREKLDSLIQEKILLAGKTQVVDVVIDVTQKIDWVDPPSYFGGSIVFDYRDYFAIADKSIEINLKLTPTEVKFKSDTETIDENPRFETFLQVWERPNSQIAKEEYVKLSYNENNEKTQEYKETLIYDLTDKPALKIIEERNFVDGFTPVQGESEKILYYTVENGKEKLYKSIIKKYDYVFVGGETLYDYDKPLGVTTYLSLPELGIENAVIEQEEIAYFSTGEISERSFKEFDFRGENVLNSRKTEYQIMDIVDHLVVTKNYEGDFDAENPELIGKRETTTAKTTQGSEEEEVITIKEFDGNSELISTKTITSEKKPALETTSSNNVYPKTGKKDFSSQTTMFDNQGNIEKETEQRLSNMRNSYSEKTYTNVDGVSRIGREIAINSSGEKTISEEIIYEYLTQEDKITKKCFIGKKNDTTPWGRAFKIITAKETYLSEEKRWPYTEIKELFQVKEINVYDSLSIDESCPNPDSLPKALFEETFSFSESDEKKRIEKNYFYDYDEEGNPIRELFNESNIYKKKGNSLELIGSILSRKNYIIEEFDISGQYAELPFEDRCEEITGLNMDFVAGSHPENKPVERINENFRISETGERYFLSTKVIHYSYYESGKIKIKETNLFSNEKLIKKETEHFDLENTLICSHAKVNCKEMRFEC